MNYLLGIFPNIWHTSYIWYYCLVYSQMSIQLHNCSPRIIIWQHSKYRLFHKIAYIIYMYAHVHFSPLLYIVGFHTWKVVTDKCIKTYIQFHFCLNLHGLIHKFAMIVVEFLVDNKWSTLNQYEFACFPIYWLQK